MTTANLKLSPFGEAAVNLDQDFTELELLSGQMDRLSLDSDAGLDRAKKILAQFGETGERVAERIQTLAKTLDEARSRAEQAAHRIGARAVEVQERQELSNRLTERLNLLNETVGKINLSLKEMKSQRGEELGAEDAAFLSEKLPELDAQLGTLSDAALQLRADAQQAGLRTIERNADSLGQSLMAARRKLGAFLPKNTEAHSALH